MLYIHQRIPRPQPLSLLPPPVPIGICLDSERSPSFPPQSLVIRPIHWIFWDILTLDRLSSNLQHAPFLPVFISKPPLELPAQTRTVRTMPVPGVYPGNPDDPAPKGTAPRTLTAAGNPDSLSPGVIGAVVTVPVLVVICMVAAATLHQLRCMNPRCKVCCVLRCRRRKPRNGT